MSYVLDTTTTDGYQYLVCPGSSQVTLQVSNAAAAIGFGENPLGRPGAGVYPPADEPYLPVLAGLGRDCDEIRVKSLTAGKPANVKIVAQ
jgi:hypothetical protein